MRRLDKEITSQDVINEILSNSSVLRIGFAIENTPHIVPVNFAHENGKLFVHSAPEGNKISLIKANNLVCFEMELYDEIITDAKACNCTTKYRSVIGWGNIRISNARDEKIHGLNLIMSKYGSKTACEYSEGMLNNMVIIIIEIDKLSGKQSGKWE